MPEGSAGFSKRTNVIPLWGETGGDEKREPPHNIEAEHALLGALLSRNDLLEKAAEKLRPEHFYNPLNSRLYGEIARVILSGRRADPVTLQGWISADVDGKAAGGHRYLSALIQATQGFEVGSYADLIREMWIRREAIARAEELIDSAYNPQTTIKDECVRLADGVDRLCTDTRSSGDISSDDAMDRAIARMEEARAKGGTGALPTGFPRVDKAVKLLPGRVAVLGGATGSGKSAIAWNWATNIGIYLRDQMKAGVNLGGILGISLEMSADDLMLRAACSVSGVAYESAENGELSKGDTERLSDARSLLRSMPLRFCDIGGLTPNQITMKCRQAQRRYGKLALIVVDHITLVKPEASDSKSGGPWAMAQVIDTIRNLAKEFDCAELILSQLKRDVTEREDHAPQITDLAWSSALEQAAHYIALLHRPEYFLAQKEPRRESAESPERFEKKISEWREMMQTWAGRGELFIRKVRTGAPRSVPLLFYGPTMTFSEDPRGG